MHWLVDGRRVWSESVEASQETSRHYGAMFGREIGTGPWKRFSKLSIILLKRFSKLSKHLIGSYIRGF